MIPMKLLTTIFILFFITSSVFPQSKPTEGKMMNPTAWHLGMKSCEEAKSEANQVFKDFTENKLDSAYYFVLSDNLHNATTERFDSIMLAEYKFKVGYPGFQPILKCYMDLLHQLLSEHYKENFELRIMEKAEKTLRN